MRAAAAILAAGLAQAPDFSGTWKLDAGSSRIESGAGLLGLVADGAPETLHLTHAANGTLVVESQINESQSRLYRPGAPSRVTLFVGPGGTLTTTSRWEGAVLVSEGRHEAPSGLETVVTEVREVFSLGRDGTMVVEITATGSGRTRTSKISYTRTHDVGPCESWPTPCKRPSR